MKKFFLIITVLFSFSSLWADELMINGLYYLLDEETLSATVSAYSFEEERWIEYGPDESGNEYTYHITNTELIGDITIRTNVTHFSKKYTVRYVDDFINCINISSIIIPKTVLEIHSFSGCSSLTSVNIPNNVSKIYGNIFSDCSNLTSITVSSGNTTYDSRDDCNAIIESSTNVLMSGCKNTIIPSSVTSIGPSAFSGCTSLTSIDIPNSVTSIRYDAFSRCGLATIEIPNSVTSIESATFEDCTDLTSVTIPNSVSSIGSYAFYGCTKLSYINIPNNVTSIEQSVFERCVSLTTIDIPTSVTSIGYYAFEGCGLTKIVIPNSVTTIQEAFWGCSDLTYVELHCSEIEEDVFKHLGSIETLILGNELTKVGRRAFESCSGLTNLTIPQSLTNIGSDAFKNCSKLKNVTVQINDYTAFCNNNSIHLVCSSVNNVMLLDMIGNEIKEYDIPNDVTSIGDNAFKYCSVLTTINIPSSVTKIGDNSFYNCSGLTSLYIPGSVTSIGNNSFYNCSNLTSISVDESNSVYDSRENCNAVIETASNTLMLGCNNTFIPHGVKTLSSNSFLNCSSISSITIPNSVTNIGNYAFSGCSKLIDVYVENTNPITIESDVFSSRSYATLYVPKGSRDIYRSALTWREFKEIIESEGRNTQTLAFESIPTMTYGDAPFTLPEITNEGLPLSWNCSNTNTVIISGNIMTIKGAGNATIVASQTGNDNYQPFSKNFTLKVVKAPLTITANNTERFEGEINSEFSLSYDGFVYDDDASCLTTPPTATTTATASSAPGVYPITVSGAEAENYDISYMDGILTIVAALPFVTLELTSEYALFTPQKDVDMTNVSGVEAYVAVHYGRLDNIVKLERAYSIPSGTGVLIKGIPGTYRLPLTVANNSYGSLLKGIMSDTTIDRRTGDFINLTLSTNNSFVPVADGTSLAAHTAYLQLPVSVYTGSAPVDIDLQSGVSGDTNNDGKITIADVMKLLQMVMNN